jgi:hypothetical protein
MRAACLLLLACGGRTEIGTVVVVSADGGLVNDSSLVDVSVSNDAGCNADLLTDPENCAVCGHSCLGGTCVGGNCQPRSFPVPDGDRALALALTTTDVVFTTKSGSVWRMSKQGGLPQLLAPPFPIDPIANAAGLVVIGDLAFEASLLTKSIRVIPISGGPLLTALTPPPTGLATDGQNVYIATTQGPLTRLLPKATIAVPVQSAANTPLNAVGIAMDTTDVFVANLAKGPASHAIFRFPLGPTAANTLSIDDCVEPCPLAVDSERVYSIQGPANQATVAATTISNGGTVTALAKDATYGGIAVDDRFVYYAQIQGVCSSPPCKSGLARVKKVFSLPTTLAVAGEPAAIVLDANAIYYSSTAGITILAKP